MTADKMEHSRVISNTTPIEQCDICANLADQAFDASQPAAMGEIASRFLNHVIKDHTSELLQVLAEKYVPVFMKRRSLR